MKKKYIKDDWEREMKWLQWKRDGMEDFQDSLYKRIDYLDKRIARYDARIHDLKERLKNE